MALLANWVLEVGGLRVGASAPEFGDRTMAERRETLALTVGVAVTDLEALRASIGMDARLLTGDDRELAKLKLEKIDNDLSLVVAEVTELSPLLRAGMQRGALPLPPPAEA